MPTTAKTTETTYFHLSLNVADIDRSVAFYRDLLGVEPSKLHGDYARFTPESPPLVLSLLRRDRDHEPEGPQRLSHLGFRVGSAEAQRTARARLAAAGHEPRQEPESRCCYALQDKFWVLDPDGNEWEFYRLLEDLESKGEDSRGCCD